MTGFLQRMVQSARTPLGSIRPITGSIFSAHQNTGILDTPEVFEEVAASRPVAPTISPAIETPLLESGEREQEPIVSKVAPPIRQTAETFEQVRPIAVPSPVRQLGDTFQQTVHDKTRPADTMQETSSIEAVPFKPLVQTLLQEKSIEQPAKSAVNTDPGTAVRQRSEQPAALNAATGFLDVDETTPEAYVQVRNTSRPLASRTGRKHIGRQQVDHNQPSRQADEILISIGRIEITAVPAPQERPPAKQPSKTPDLSAYLKRRSGSGQ